MSSAARSTPDTLYRVYTLCSSVMSEKRSWKLFRFLRSQYELLIPSFVERHRQTLVEANVLNCMAVCILDDIVDVHGDLETYEQLQARYVESIFRGPSSLERSRPLHDAIITMATELRARLESLPRFSELSALMRFELVQGLHSTRLQGILGLDLEKIAPLMLDAYTDTHANSMFMKFTYATVVAAVPDVGLRTHRRLREYIARAQLIYVLMYDLMNYAQELRSGELCNLSIHRLILGHEASSWSSSTPRILHERIDALKLELDAWVAARSKDALVVDAHAAVTRMFAQHVRLAGDLALV